jgi:MYXO-CTERM domain-containing protein
MKSIERPSRSDQHPYLHACLVAGLGLFAARNALAAEYYVAPTGSDTNPGTQASPFASVQKANDAAAAGDTIWMRAGTYYSTTQIVLSKSGTSDTNRTKIWAYPGEVPLLDCSKYQTTSPGTNTPAILVTGSFMHLKGLEIGNSKVGASGDHSYSTVQTKGASHDTFELLNLHHGFGAGLFIDDTKGGGGHLILNCDSHDNYDINGSQGDGQNADGFGHHYQKTGDTSIFRGCRSWWNSDDGYDFIYQDVPLIVENCWAMGSGHPVYGTASPADGNGNGFKMGGNVTNTRHMIRNCVAWKNKDSGFYSNHSTGGHTWYNNTAFQNGTDFNMLSGPSAAPIQLTGALAHILRNNISYTNKTANMGGVDTQFNTWDLKITPKASDFLSIDDPSVSGTGQAIEASSLAFGPRQADGSLPNIDFLKLAAGSQMIDKGTDVGLTFVGAAPDLGAYEYGATGGTSGLGGAPGAGGAPGTGGASATGGKPGAGGSTGGASATGGRNGTGGTPMAGAPGTGGTTAIGGAPGTGGTTATGGRTGGSGTGGLASTGGAVGTGGSPTATGGIVTSGGTIGTGGLPATGGVASTGGVGTGGTPGPGGTGGTLATGGTTSDTGPTQTSSGGCSCRIAAARTTSHGTLALLGLVMVALRVRKRR